MKARSGTTTSRLFGLDGRSETRTSPARRLLVDAKRFPTHMSLSLTRILHIPHLRLRLRRRNHHPRNGSKLLGNPKASSHLLRGSHCRRFLPTFLALVQISRQAVSQRKTRHRSRGPLLLKHSNPLLPSWKWISLSSMNAVTKSARREEYLGQIYRQTPSPSLHTNARRNL